VDLGTGSCAKAPAAGRSICPTGSVLSTDEQGKTWRTAVEAELTRKDRGEGGRDPSSPPEGYDDVVYKAAPGRYGR
jgi:hypothetical protein